MTTARRPKQPSMESASLLWLIAVGALMIFVIVAVAVFQSQDGRFLKATDVVIEDSCAGGIGSSLPKLLCHGTSIV